MGDSYRLIELLESEFSIPFSPIHGAEIGVHRGETSRLLLERFQNLRLIMVDPWATYEEGHPYRNSGDGCAKLTREQQTRNMGEAIDNVSWADKRWAIYRYPSHEAFQVLSAENEFISLDFVFIDGDHTYQAVYMDMMIWWKVVKRGGILCGHDYGHPRCRRGVWGVDQAVSDFCSNRGLEFNVLGSIWWIRK